MFDDNPVNARAGVAAEQQQTAEAVLHRLHLANITRANSFCVHALLLFLSMQNMLSIAFATIHTVNARMQK